MDKIDGLLRDKAEDEINDFVLPESFNNKIEELLENIDEKECKNKWYSQKKILAMVACFAFMFLVGIRSITMTNKQSMARDGAMPQVARNEVENYNLGNADKGDASGNPNSDTTYGNTIIDCSTIQNITIKILDEQSTYKFIDKKDDIDKVISYINSIEKIEVQKQDLQQWDILIQTTGATNHSILLSGNILNIDDKCYEINGEALKELLKIYDELSYEEKDIKYCNY